MFPVPRWAQSGDTETLRPPPALTPLSHVSRVTSLQKATGLALHSDILTLSETVGMLDECFSDSLTLGLQNKDHLYLVTRF